MLFSIWAKTFLAFIVSRYEPSSLRMRIGNANVASTKLETVKEKKQNENTSRQFWNTPFPQFESKRQAGHL